MRVFVAVGAGVLAFASAASAATFKSSAGKFVVSKHAGITVSGGSWKFTGVAKPGRPPNFAGGFDFTSGQAKQLRAPVTLILKHKGRKATLHFRLIDRRGLMATLNDVHLACTVSSKMRRPPRKCLRLSLNRHNEKVKPNSTFTGASVSGVVLMLTKSDASKLNGALRTRVFKGGRRLGTVSYRVIDRELIETSGTNTLCFDKSFYTHTTANNVIPSPMPGTATTTNSTDCRGTNDMGLGLNFQTPFDGFIDTATKTGQLAFFGGIRETQGSTTADIDFLTVDLQGSNSDLRADVFAAGVSRHPKTIGTVRFTSAPHLKFNRAGGTLTIPADGATVALNSTGASILNTVFCSSTCAGGDYKAGEVIGYSRDTTTLK